MVSYRRAPDHFDSSFRWSRAAVAAIRLDHVSQTQKQDDDNVDFRKSESSAALFSGVRDQTEELVACAPLEREQTDLALHPSNVRQTYGTHLSHPLFAAPKQCGVGGVSGRIVPPADRRLARLTSANENGCSAFSG